ncbi:MAG: hypothetical protein WCJ45_08095 [bacterium]
MAHDERIDKQATIQKIVDWANKSIGRSINISKFNDAMEDSDWETTLKEMAEFCGIEIVYA